MVEVENKPAGEEVAALPDHRCLRKDGRIDRRLEQFDIAISCLCAAATIDVHEINFPPNLTRERVAEAAEKIDETIKQLRKVKARLAAYVAGGGDKASISDSSPPAPSTGNDML